MLFHTFQLCKERILSHSLDLHYQNRGAVGAREAHNLEVGGSKPLGAIFFAALFPETENTVHGYANTLFSFSWK